MNMEEKKIIFLDIDGVLAGEDFFRKRLGGFIDPKKIELINQLKGAEIVISSSWGYDNGRTEKSLRDCGLTLPIIGYTKHEHVDWICRGNVGLLRTPTGIPSTEVRKLMKNGRNLALNT